MLCYHTISGASHFPHLQHEPRAARTGNKTQKEGATEALGLSFGDMHYQCINAKLLRALPRHGTPHGFATWETSHDWKEARPVHAWVLHIFQL